MEVRKLISLGLALMITSLMPLAWAQQKNTMQVVSIDSDDAEDQAEAFTGALKSRLRATPGLSVNDSTNSLGPLTTALKCPPKPDAACLLRIADHLKVEKFFWGTMSKAGGKQVTLDLHYWERGKNDQSVKETFSDNLKDQNDDVLRKIAARLFEKLTGTGASAAAIPAKITVHIAGDTDDGTVIIDGTEVAKLEHGLATVEVKSGHHDIELRTADGKIGKRSVDVTAETTVTLQAVAAPPPEPPPPSKPFPTRKVIGFATVGLGLAAAAIGVVEGVQFVNLQSKNSDDHKRPEFMGIKDFCNITAQPQAGPNSTACQTIKDAETARALELVFFGAGAALIATGFVIVITDPGPRQSDRPTAATVRLVPSVGHHGGGLGLVGTF